MRFNPENPLKIGTRSSPLALAQAEETKARLMAALDAPAEWFQIVPMSTKGDRNQERNLSEIGGKGLFTEDLEAAMQSGEIDIAVHSMKDMPVHFPDGLTIQCVLPREDIRDGFVSLKYEGIADLPDGAIVGTSSLRRAAQILARRPDINVVPFRGNVQTRLQKLSDNVADATFLACAGLNRLGMGGKATPIAPQEMMPAVAQGAIGIEQRADDSEVTDVLEKIHDSKTWVQITAERAFLEGLDGSCQTPIASFTEMTDDQLILHGEVLRPDGSEALSGTREGKIADAADMGADLARDIKARMSADFFA